MAKKKNSLYGNIHKKRARIKRTGKGRMRRPGEAGRPTAANFKRAAKTAKRRKSKKK